jgi:hypothetical protein
VKTFTSSCVINFELREWPGTAAPQLSLPPAAHHQLPHSSKPTPNRLMSNSLIGALRNTQSTWGTPCCRYIPAAAHRCMETSTPITQPCVQRYAHLARTLIYWQSCEYSLVEAAFTFHLRATAQLSLHVNIAPRIACNTYSFLMLQLRQPQFKTSWHALTVGRNSSRPL